MAINNADQQWQQSKTKSCRLENQKNDLKVAETLYTAELRETSESGDTYL